MIGLRAPPNSGAGLGDCVERDDQRQTKIAQPGHHFRWYPGTPARASRRPTATHVGLDAAARLQFGQRCSAWLDGVQEPRQIWLDGVVLDGGRTLEEPPRRLMDAPRTAVADQIAPRVSVG